MNALVKSFFQRVATKMCRPTKAAHEFLWPALQPFLKAAPETLNRRKLRRQVESLFSYARSSQDDPSYSRCAVRIGRPLHSPVHSESPYRFPDNPKPAQFHDPERRQMTLRRRFPPRRRPSSRSDAVGAPPSDRTNHSLRSNHWRFWASAEFG